jgi:hypothetical protein
VSEQRSVPLTLATFALFAHRYELYINYELQYILYVYWYSIIKGEVGEEPDSSSAPEPTSQDAKPRIEPRVRHPFYITNVRGEGLAF